MKSAIIGRGDRPIAKDDAKNNFPPVLWCRKDIANFFGLHVSSIYRLERNGLLPQPAKGFGSKRWIREEVLEALKNVKRMRSEKGDDD